MLPLKWSDERVYLAESLQNLLARKAHCIDKNIPFYSRYFGANVISGYVAYEWDWFLINWFWRDEALILIHIDSVKDDGVARLDSS